MQLFDSANPLYMASTGGTVVSIVASTNQGAVVGDAAVSGSTHILAFQPTGYHRNVITPVYPTLTLTGVVPTDSCVINGITYTAVASGATAFQFNIGGSDALTAANLATQFNANQKVGFGAAFLVKDALFDIGTLVTGTGTVGATMQLQASLNGVDWISHPGQAAQSPSGTSLAQVISSELTPYPYLRTNVSALTGTGARVQVFYSPTRLN